LGNRGANAGSGPFARQDKINRNRQNKTNVIISWQEIFIMMKAIIPLLLIMLMSGCVSTEDKILAIQVAADAVDDAERIRVVPYENFSVEENLAGEGIVPDDLVDRTGEHVVVRFREEYPDKEIILESSFHGRSPWKNQGATRRILEQQGWLNDGILVVLQFDGAFVQGDGTLAPHTWGTTQLFVVDTASAENYTYPGAGGMGLGHALAHVSSDYPDQPWLEMETSFRERLDMMFQRFDQYSSGAGGLQSGSES
jgi:hypothetical protein